MLSESQPGGELLAGKPDTNGFHMYIELISITKVTSVLMGDLAMGMIPMMYVPKSHSMTAHVLHVIHHRPTPQHFILPRPVSLHRHFCA